MLKKPGNVCAVKNAAYQPASENSDPKQIVSEAELEQYLADGWDVQTVLPSGRILIHRDY